MIEEKKENKRSVIVIAGKLGAIVFCIIAGFSGHQEYWLALGSVIFILALDKYVITPYHWRERIHIFINKYQKPISYISFSIFLFLIIIIILFRFILK